MFLFEWLLPINCILVYVLLRLASQWRAGRRRVAGDGTCSGVTHCGALDRDLSLGLTICLLTLGVIGSTEILSVFQVISRRSLILFWGGVDALLVLAILLLLWGMLRCDQPRLGLTMRVLVTRVRRHWLSALLTLVLVGVVVGLGVTAVRLSWLTVPYNWDSMTYHLGRVAHWYQNGSVAHYASNIDRQILSPTLGEFLVLQVYTLAGGSDRSVNQVQCAAYLLCAIMVVRLARRLGARHWQACVAGILFMTMPIAFAESLTTQNDLVSAVYLLVFVTMAMDIWQQEQMISLRSRNLLEILCMGLCIGFGYLVKPSVCLGMVVFLLPVLMSCRRRRDSVATVLGCMVLAGVAAGLVAAPELARMYGTYHAFSSPQAGARQMVGSADPRMLLLNFLKNIAFNLPNALMPGLQECVMVFLTGLAVTFGVDLNDPAISEDGRAYEIHVANEFGHDTAVNAVVFWAWLVCLALLLVTLVIRCARRRKELETLRAAHVYIGTTTIAFVLFWFVVRWEKYEVRYMVPYLALICVAIPLALQMVLSRLLGDRYLQPVLILLAAILLMPSLMIMREVTDYHTTIASEMGSRPEGYYKWRRAEYDPQLALCATIKDAGYTTVGLYCDGDYYEYPLYAQLGSDIEIRHVFVNNETAQYEDAGDQPDCILFLGCALPEEYDSQGYLVYHGTEYMVQTAYDDEHLLLVKE